MSTTEADPRRQSTGVSGEARGTIAPPSNATTELGSANTEPLRDVVPELGTRRQALLKYREMINNDAAVNVSLRSMKVPILGADYFVEPASEAPQDIEISDFVRYNLLEGLNAPFLNSLEDILHFFEDGYAVLESVYEQREWVPVRKGANRRRYTMLRKLAVRPANSIKEFQYDDQGGPRGVVQQARDAKGAVKDVTIPIDKLIIFTFNKRGGNLEGTSILRSSYKHWYYKDVLYRIDAIQKERHGIGVPFIELPPGYSPDDRDFALQLVRNIRTNEEAGFVIPPGYDMGFKKPEGELVDVLASVEHHNGMIMMNTMSQFLLMGIQDSGGGGRATSGSHQNMYEKSLRFVATLICQYINMFLIPPLVAYNFDTDKFPRLNVRNLGEGKDLQMWASAMANLSAQGLITLDKETEQWVRQTIDAPLKLGERPETQEATSNRGNVKPGDSTKGQGNVGKAANES
jgi:hypothetical protein